MDSDTPKNSAAPANPQPVNRSAGGADAPVKQQITERIKQANNLLVTVSNNPSVDQLAACIGLTILLNKMDKHATAVFSGKAPSTIEFLRPEKTLETNTDSLRDFIISLDKSKADKLRYKVEDQVVRIFITPYKTSLSEKDLVYSQGDFNVEVVLALGVHDRSQLDAAITSHGRIMHDATVVSINAGQGNAPRLGQLNWQEAAASSLCEMIVSISEAFGGGLIDNQIATAFLTGIVAETQRFSNAKTSPKVMTMSAQLMAAGANQQLIVSKLEPPPPPPPKPQPPKAPPKATEPQPKPEKKGDKDGILSVSHEPAKADSPEVQVDPNEIKIDEQGNIKTAEEIKAELEAKKSELPEKPELNQQAVEPPPVPAPGAFTIPAPPPPPPPPPIIKSPPQPFQPPPAPPATPPQPEQDLPGPHSLLNPTEHRPTLGAPFTANTGDSPPAPAWSDPYNTVPIDPVNSPPAHAEGTFEHSRVVQPPPHQPGHLSGLASQLTPEPPTQPQANAAAGPPSIDNARSAVDNAIASQPFNPAFNPEARLGSTPVNLPIHPEQAGTAPPTPTGPPPTPTFNLPGGGNGEPPQPTPPPAAGPPPPPFPPPPPLPPNPSL